MTGNDNEPAPARAYEKGIDRFKHVGSKDVPEIVFVNHSPKHRLGLCPRGVSDDLKVQLLNEAIPDDNGDRDLAFHKRLHVVHEGTIYRAETTTFGKSYHAFPYAGKLGKAILAALGSMADAKECRREFDKWLDMHIEPHGK